MITVRHYTIGCYGFWFDDWLRTKKMVVVAENGHPEPERSYVTNGQQIEYFRDKVKVFV